MIAEQYTELENNYNVPGLSEKILNTLKTVKNNPTSYVREDFSTFDEFHLQGIQGTRELAKMVPIKQHMKILDLGSGIGGAARTLATEHDVQVYGVELIQEYFKASQMLSELCHLESKTKFFHGSALNAPFENQSFDVVWMQHMNMNIQDKNKLYSEAARVVKENGKIALYEICKGSSTTNDFFFPVPWANNEQINHLITIEEISSIILNLGFKQIKFANVTDSCLKWINAVLEKQKSGVKNPLGLHIVVNNDFAQKIINLGKNIEQNNVEVIMAVFEKKT